MYNKIVRVLVATHLASNKQATISVSLSRIVLEISILPNQFTTNRKTATMIMISEKTFAK